MANIISVDADIKATMRQLTGLARDQIPFATSVAINNLAKRGQEAIRNQMQAKLDRPKPYTLGGTFIARGNKRNPVATVGLIDKPRGANRAPVKYLSAQVAGGARPMAGYEVALRAIGVLPNGWRAVPAERVDLDRYGNMFRRDLAEIIGALKSGLRVAAGRGKNSHYRGYFVAGPGIRNTAHLHPGVWLRIEREGGKIRKWSKKRKNSGLQPVLLFVDRTSYKPTLDIRGAVETAVRLHARSELDSAVEYALNTAR